MAGFIQLQRKSLALYSPCCLDDAGLLVRLDCAQKRQSNVDVFGF